MLPSYLSAQSLQQAERPLQINCCPDVGGDDRTIADFFIRLLRPMGRAWLGSARSGALGIDDASAHVASTFFITSVGSDAGDEGSAGVAGAFAESAGSDALVIDDGPAHVASTSLIKSAGSGVSAMDRLVSRARS